MYLKNTRMSLNSFIALLASLVLIISCSDMMDNSDADDNHPDSDYIIFTSEGSSFSPVIIVDGSPEIEWVWDDGNTDSSTTPTKDYGSTGTRINKLRVDPWSSLVRINIGYDGGDGGSALIEHVANQNISSVENLNLAAPYLQYWCSSYNSIPNLDFSNFIALDTIECFKSTSLQNVELRNTPALKRACFEDCDLISLDLSDCISLEDLRGALNSYPTIDFGGIGTNTWHICIRDNPQFTNNLFADMTNYPNIEELFLWRDNQNGNLLIPSTGNSRNVDIQVYQNGYEYVDLRGALQNTSRNGYIDLSDNNISEIYIDGCSQINYLDLENNALGSAQINTILSLLDSFGRINGTLNLTGNTPPSTDSSTTIASLQGKGWTVTTD